MLSIVIGDDNDLWLASVHIKQICLNAAEPAMMSSHQDVYISHGIGEASISGK